VISKNGKAGSAAPPAIPAQSKPFNQQRTTATRAEARERLRRAERATCFAFSVERSLAIDAALVAYEEIDP
jgi:hypothetical protein